MIMRLRTRHVALSIILLVVPHPFLKLQNPACGQEVSKDAEAALKERDRLWEETQKLYNAGKLAEAITAAEAMLAIERKLLPADQ
jgi:hypothetical protein